MVSLRSFFKTVTARLMVWYILAFGLLSFIQFAIIYEVTSHHLQEQSDHQLNIMAKEMIGLFNLYGEGEALQKEFVREARSRGEDWVFFRLISTDGRIIALSDLTHWLEHDELWRDPRLYDHDAAHFTFVQPPGHAPIRLGVFPVNANIYLEIGRKQTTEENVLTTYKVTYSFTLIIMLAVGGLVGWILGNTAMKGVRKVTKVAADISRKGLGLRVSPTSSGQEIHELVTTFNSMLSRIEVLMGEFRTITNNVAHELRTPITQIRGSAETTLKAEDQIEEYRSMAVDVIEGCDVLMEIIDTMLEIAQSESGLVQLSVSDQNLPDLLEDAVDLFEPIASEKQLKVQLDLPPSTKPVPCDRKKMQRVIANLLDNAIKYTPPGGTIRLRYVEAPSHICIHVEDSGQGIPEKDMPYIFNRFFRCDPSRTTPGSGLGLSLAKSLVEAHQGSLSVKNSDHGAHFIIQIPTLPNGKLGARFS